MTRPSPIQKSFFLHTMKVVARQGGGKYFEGGVYYVWIRWIRLWRIWLRRRWLWRWWHLCACSRTVYFAHYHRCSLLGINSHKFQKMQGS